MLAAVLAVLFAACALGAADSDGAGPDDESAERAPSASADKAQRPDLRYSAMGGCTISCGPDPGPCPECGGDTYGGEGTSSCSVSCNGGVGDNARCECTEGKAHCYCNW